MRRYVVLLRGVNVGKANRIPMAAFRELLANAGADDPQTYLQSGNAVVGWPRTADDLGKKVAAGLSQLGLTVPVMVRTATQLQTVVDEVPYDLAARNPKLFHVGFLAGPVAAQTWDAVDHDTLAPSSCALGKGVVYLDYVGGVQNNPLNRLRLGVSLTARNWRTVLALRGLVDASPA